MKSLFVSIFFCCLTTFLFGQQNKASVAIVDTTKKVEVVETACGQCQFGMTGKGCTLAVRIKGTAYFVVGTSIDDHGDAHDATGFCNAVRKAQVQGKIENNKFVVSYFNLLKPVGEVKE